MRKGHVPNDVAIIRAELIKFLNTRDAQGRVVGAAKVGVYAFFDYDGEPIYVGQTKERLRGRICRHLTNHRTDAVAMNVLDPFEVYEVEMWPFYDLPPAEVDATLAAAEFTVYQKVLSQSTYGAVLNEKGIPNAKEITMPPSVRGKIVPDELYQFRKHADIRIARRASTIAALSRVISERTVSSGLRRTLLTQARRLETLAKRRYEETVGDEEPESEVD